MLNILRSHLGQTNIELESFPANINWEEMWERLWKLSSSEHYSLFSLLHLSEVLIKESCKHFTTKPAEKVLLETSDILGHPYFLPTEFQIMFEDRLFSCNIFSSNDKNDPMIVKTKRFDKVLNDRSSEVFSGKWTDYFAKNYQCFLKRNAGNQLRKKNSRQSLSSCGSSRGSLNSSGRTTPQLVAAARQLRKISDEADAEAELKPYDFFGALNAKRHERSHNDEHRLHMPQKLINSVGRLPIEIHEYWLARFPTMFLVEFLATATAKIDESILVCTERGMEFYFRSSKNFYDLCNQVKCRVRPRCSIHD